MSQSQSVMPTFDRAGVVVSTLCAAHCALCALLPSLFFLVGLDALLSHEAEWAFTLFAVALAAVALLIGWRTHRSRLVACLFGLGIAGLLVSRQLEDSVELAGTAVGVIAAMGLVAAHVASLSRSRSRGC